MRVAMVALALLVPAGPAFAETFLELGTTPHLGMTWETSQLAIGTGLSLRWDTLHIPAAFGQQDYSVYVIQPGVAVQFFLNQERSAHSFVEFRAEKGIPIVTKGPQKGFLDSVNDNWFLAAGGGLKSDLGERVVLGGAVDGQFQLLTIPGQSSEVTARTLFRVFLQYRL